MRDLRLSEAKGICKKHKDCRDCELFDYKRGLCFITRVASPEYYEIDEEQPKDRVDTLEDTIDLMTSADYKERFKAEYYQLKIRFVKLGTMVKNWEEGKLDFTPTCSKVIYERQLNAMADYILVLEKRANIEGIELN